uniref:Uncharacterized protein n=1 Tax=Avena sativa TaxID=4498 RepID=A0ACD5V174_AVESA
MEPPPTTTTPVIPREAWEGCSVLLDINDGDRLAFFRLTAGATVKIGDKSCSLQPLVGRPFGSLFRVGPSGLVPCAAEAPSQDGNIQDGANGQAQDETRDNRSLVDNNTAQTLSSEDIEAMKREGASGDAIVEALIANSSTFGNKTVFSQEKYKLKKQKKYAPKVLLRRPTTRSICETYFKKYPARIGFMRVDTLSLLLSMANVGAYSDVLVVDMVGGLVAGAVAERLGGTGYVCSTYLGSAPSSIDIIKMYNLSGDMTSRIFQAQLSDLCSLQKSGNAPSALSESIQDCKGNNGASIAPKSLRAGKAPSPERIKYWEEHGFSSLIVAAPGHEVESLVADLLPLLSYSAPFAIYHQHLQTML